MHYLFAQLNSQLIKNVDLAQIYIENAKDMQENIMMSLSKKQKHGNVGLKYIGTIIGVWDLINTKMLNHGGDMLRDMIITMVK